MPAIPEPQLIGDEICGALLHADGGLVLAIGGLPVAYPTEHIARPRGQLVIRYALAYLQREAWIVPGLFASEYGAILLGREAWNFALEHTNLHPRADIVGLRSDGRADQVMLRQLDFGRPVAVIAYETPSARLPLGNLVAFWADPDAPELPDLLVEHLPRLERLP